MILFVGVRPVSTVPHNCHGKTKSHGKTKKTSWSAVDQRLLIASEMVRRVTVTHCSLEKPPFFELTMFCTACGSVVDEDANFCKNCGRGTFVNLKCSYLHFFKFQITIGVRRHCYKLADQHVSGIRLCTQAGNLGNFVVDCLIQSTSSRSAFANVAKKQSNVWIRRHYN